MKRKTSLNKIMIIKTHKESHKLVGKFMLEAAYYCRIELKNARQVFLLQ